MVVSTPTEDVSVENKKPNSTTGENHRFDRCILDWTSWTASKEASLEGKVLGILKMSKYINRS